MTARQSAICFSVSLLVSVALTLPLGAAPAQTAGDAASDLTAAIQLYNRHAYADAFKKLEIAKASDSTDPKVYPRIYYYEALCLQQMGQTPKAARVYEMICNSYPGSQEARLSQIYLGQLQAQLAAIAKRKSPSPPPRRAAPTPEITSFAAANASDEDLAGLPDRTSVPFTRGRDGHLFVNISVDGRPMNVMFDTGASICLFGKNHLQQAGINPSLSGRRVALAGVGSSTNYGQAMVVDLGVGDMVRHMPIIVQEKLDTPPLLGETFFNGFKYDIDNQAGLIRFTKKSRGGSSSRASSDIPYDTINVPFTQVGNNMVVNAEVMGRPCKMYFDTGASLIAFPAQIWGRLGLGIPSNAQPTGVSGVGGTSMAFSFNIPELKVGALTKTNVPITVVQQGGMPIPLLGQPFFSDRRFTIDNENHLIRFFR